MDGRMLILEKVFALVSTQYISKIVKIRGLKEEIVIVLTSMKSTKSRS